MTTGQLWPQEPCTATLLIACQGCHSQNQGCLRNARHLQRIWELAMFNVTMVGGKNCGHRYLKAGHKPPASVNCPVLPLSTGRGDQSFSQPSPSRAHHWVFTFLRSEAVADVISSNMTQSLSARPLKRGVISMEEGKQVCASLSHQKLSLFFGKEHWLDHFWMFKLLILVKYLPGVKQ